MFIYYIKQQTLSTFSSNIEFLLIFIHGMQTLSVKYMYIRIYMRTQIQIYTFPICDIPLIIRILCGKDIIFCEYICAANAEKT